MQSESSKPFSLFGRHLSDVIEIDVAVRIHGIQNRDLLSGLRYSSNGLLQVSRWPVPFSENCTFVGKAASGPVEARLVRARGAV